MPSILLQIAFVIFFIWSIIMLVQDFKLARKVWMNVLLHASVAVVSLHFFLSFYTM